MLEAKVFDRRRMDFVGTFPSSCENEYILLAADYVTKWVEVISAPKLDAKTVVKFLKNIFSIFGTQEF